MVRFKSQIWIVLILFFLSLPVIAKSQVETNEKTYTVFNLEEMYFAQQGLQALLKSGQLLQAEKTLKAVFQKYPKVPAFHLLSAQLSFSNRDYEAMFRDIGNAIDYGFRDAQRLTGFVTRMPELAERPELKALLRRMEASSQPQPLFELLDVKPNPVRSGVGVVDRRNTEWDTQVLAFRSSFVFPSRKFSGSTADLSGTPSAKLLNSLVSQGKAAGNTGDLYDNRDRRHSLLDLRQLPQLSAVAYSPEAASVGLDYGVNFRALFGAPTIGNASLGLTGARSLVQSHLIQPGTAKRLFVQYLNNQVYVYPAVRDFAPFENDNFFANTPYLLNSKGKSGSDKPLLFALANILAALDPALKDELTQQGTIGPVVQSVFRWGQAGIESDTDYLSGRAHPVVFDGAKIDLENMVRRSQALSGKDIVPYVRLKVLMESSGGRPLTAAQPPGRGFGFDSPAAISRIEKQEGRDRKMVVSATPMVNGTNEGVVLEWVLLQGDPSRVEINYPASDDRSAELLIKWHNEFPSSADEKITTRRVDIGVFARRGDYISAPSFISVFFGEEPVKRPRG